MSPSKTPSQIVSKSIAKTVPKNPSKAGIRNHSPNGSRTNNDEEIGSKKSSPIMQRLLWILFAVGVITSFIVFASYDINHLYYTTQAPNIFSVGSNWMIMIVVLLCGSLPLMAYFMGMRKVSSLFFSFVVGLCLRMLIHTSIRSGVSGVAPGDGGSLLLLFNTLFLFVLTAGYSLIQRSVGYSLLQSFGFLPQSSLHRHVLSFGIGFACTLLFVHFLTIFSVLHWSLIWLYVAGGIALAYRQRDHLRAGWSMIVPEYSLSQGWMWGYAILIVLAVAYYYYGFSHSFIPYSTAWDANHAYMYCPKVFAENMGVGSTLSCGQSPTLWYSFISFWFTLMQPVKSRFWLAPDTVAVSTNFLGGILSLFFGSLVVQKIAAVWELFTGNSVHDDTKKIGDSTGNLISSDAGGTMFFGIAQLLLFLTSGMGAFLVFVDNKTDLGVFGLTLLGLWFGLEYFFFGSTTQGHIVQDETQETERKISDLTQGWYNMDLIASATFFVLAGMSKVTALQDMLLFGILIVMIRTNIVLGVGIGVLSVGILAKINILASSLFVPATAAGPWLVVGAVLTLVGIGWMLYRKTFDRLFGLIRWGILILVLLFVIKTPQIVMSAPAGTLTPSSYIKSLLIGSTQHSPHLDTEKNLVSTDNSSSDGEYHEKRVLFAGTISHQRLVDEFMTESVPDEVTPAQLAEIAPELAIYCPITSVDDEEGINVSSSPVVSPGVCRSSPVSSEGLYSGLLESAGGGLNEDLQRYIGFGQREFVSEGVFSLPVGLLKMFLPANGCVGRHADATIICNQKPSLATKTIPEFRTLLGQLDPQSEGRLLLSCLLYKREKENSILQADIARQLTAYADERTIVTVTDASKSSIAIPYRYFVPLNATVINSLQNLSSYYTDIGFVLFLSLLLIVLGTIGYGYQAIRAIIMKKDQDQGLHLVLTFCVTSLVGWMIWWVIGSAIFWYGIGLTIWTLMASMLIFFRLYRSFPLYASVSLTFLLLMIGIQFFYNYMRIASQGGGGNFVRYKASVGTQQTISFTSQGFTPLDKVVVPYRQQAIFDLQFGHYSPFIETVRERKDEDGVLIAGTYLQYFLHNQQNVMMDGLLGEFWKRQSDGNLCGVYNRLMDKNIRYLVIDPNILSIVMGDGNSTLKNRMYATLTETGSIKRDGVVTSMVKMINAGYLRLNYSNNLGAKYAFTLSDEELVAAIDSLSVSLPATASFRNDLVQTRAKLALLRFFPEVNDLYQIVLAIYSQRVRNPSLGLADLASMYGKTIDSEKVLLSFQKIIAALDKQTGLSPELVEQVNADLTQDEMVVIANYLQIYRSVLTATSAQQQEVQQMLANIVQQSLAGSSQLIVLERVDK